MPQRNSFLLCCNPQLLAECVSRRHNTVALRSRSTFDEHASLDTSQSQTQRDSATLKATHDDSVVTCRHCLRRIQGHETDLITTMIQDFTSREPAGVGPAGHTEQLKHQNLKLPPCYKLNEGATVRQVGFPALW